MSGNEELTARFLHGEFFKFRPQFKLWLSTNHKPVIPGNDRAMFDRCKLVPFTYRVPDDQIDKELEAKLLAESSGILNWLIEGCLMWQREGLEPPKSVVDATEQYRTEMDQLAAFFADRCIIGPTYRAPAAALYSAYKTWCEVNGEKQNSANWFGRQLTEREFDQVLEGPNRVRTRIGIGLLDDNNKGERNYSAQSANSGVFSKSSSHEGENHGNSAHEEKMRSSAQTRLDGTPDPIVPDEEGWL
jgi:putative DNA primase/helicase